MRMRNWKRGKGNMGFLGMLWDFEALGGRRGGLRFWRYLTLVCGPGGVPVDRGWFNMGLSWIKVP